MKRVLVVGDTILDHYIYGNVSRLNPEAPYSVVFDVDEQRKEELRLGGACNVASNIKSIYGDDVCIHYLGPICDAIIDQMSLLNIATNSDLFYDIDDILIKTRYVYEKHHMLRVDRGKKYLVKNNFYDILKQSIEQYKYDLIVVSDYDKGVVNKKTSEIIVMSGIKCLFDLKRRDNLFLLNIRKEDSPFLKDIEINSNEHVIIKCNAKEFELEMSENIIDKVCAVVKTTGPDGCDVHVDGSVHHISAPFIEMVDVVGAGDSFLAGMACKALRDDDWNPVSLSEFGVKCASEKVKHFGTHSVKMDEYV